jgi:hypothetical protein
VRGVGDGRFGGLEVKLGDGNNDRLTVTQCAAAATLFDGGTGISDTIVGSLNNFGPPPPMVTGFEIRIGI